MQLSTAKIGFILKAHVLVNDANPQKHYRHSVHFSKNQWIFNINISPSVRLSVFVVVEELWLIFRTCQGSTGDFGTHQCWHHHQIFNTYYWIFIDIRVKQLIRNSLPIGTFPSCVQVYSRLTKYKCKAESQITERVYITKSLNESMQA